MKQTNPVANSGIPSTAIPAAAQSSGTNSPTRLCGSSENAPVTVNPQMAAVASATFSACLVRAKSPSPKL